MKFLEPDGYQPNCTLLFNTHVPIIQRLLPSAKIEHIGSSAIEGLVSKGDLDILVSVDINDHSDAVEILEGSGFTIKQGTLRTAELCMLESPHEAVALQVVATGSGIESSFVGFRQALKNSAELRSAYNDLKRSSVGLEMDDYRERKSEFIQNVLRDA